MKRTWAVAVLLGLSLTGTGRASADVEPTGCARWEDAEVRQGVTVCTPRTCRSDAQCRPGHCQDVERACVVVEPAPSGHHMRERVVGACEPGRTCVVGRCVSVGTCNR